ncbi:MAG: hypothetical protein KF734_00770 [Saprospiraceae bacterium]|nr:hypothetical protein [Saprospiraceae bacterium]
MKKLVRLPILLFFALAMFFACTKEAQMSDDKTDPQGGVISATQDADGILYLKFKAEMGAVGSRDEEECTLYEAIRFFEIDEEGPNCDEDRVRVDVKFRLIKMHKQTLARTALTSFGTYSGVGGLNISWYNYPPLTDYWYAVEFEYCVRNPLWVEPNEDPNEKFWIADFWGDDGAGTHLYPCDYSDVGGSMEGPVAPPTISGPGEVVTQCTLNADCSITP